jgi:MoaA/NifB/PqqE/SkfB family radical SAM enzyme
MKTLKNNSINLDITYRCPLQCPFCDRQFYKDAIKETRQYGEMSTEDFSKILNFFNKIVFSGQTSDPIYHTDFHKLLEMFDISNCISLQVSTNGTRKSVEWWKKSYDMSKRVEWIFGLDGVDQETAEIYRKNTRFDEVFNAMLLGKEMGVNVTWQFIPFKHNEHQLDEYKKLCDRYDINHRIIQSDRWTPFQMKKHNIYPPQKEIKL